MESSVLTSPPGGAEFCRLKQCNSHGDCIRPLDRGSELLVCECDLGYDGEWCQKTVNGHLSVPLTASVIVVLIGLVVLAFVLAKLRRRRNKNRRKQAAQQGYSIRV